MVKTSTKFALLFLMFFVISETLFVSDARNVVNIPCKSRIDCSDPWDCDCKLNLCFCQPNGSEKKFLHKAFSEYLRDEKTTLLEN
uniref:Nodule Cysteine-Rich (NCR) secreted peptide n=1 Tax=Cucumis melo TaxID=3656 RepID=A0A9I9EJI7_CUCME